MTTVRFLRPIRASLLTTLLAEVLHGLLHCAWVNVVAVSSQGDYIVLAKNTFFTTFVK